MRYALRTLRRSPGFAVVALLTLAFGIGANTAIFSLVNGVLLKPLPYRDAQNIVMVWEKPPGSVRNGISTLNFLDWQRQNTVFENLAAVRWEGVTLTGAGIPEELPASFVSAPYFDIFRVQAALGRTFSSGEDQPGKSGVVVLSHRLWKSRFGEDPRILGRALTLSGKPRTVIGVLPPDGPFERGGAQLWLPFEFAPSDMTRDYHWFISYGRLKGGVTIEQARANMDAIGARIAAAYPQSNKGWGVTVDRFADQVTGPRLRQSLYVLLAAVGAVLLIVCANLANLTLARGVGRQRDLAVRSSLGASRWHIVRQLLTENLLLAAGGGLLGLLLAFFMIRGLLYLAPPYSLPQEADISMDPHILMFTLAVSVGTGLLFGLAPAFHLARVDLADSLKEGGRSSSGGRGAARLRSSLIVSEIALAFVLLTSAGLLLRSFARLQQVDTGFNSVGVVTARLPIARTRFPQPLSMLMYLRRLEDGLRSIPGVQNVAFTNALPMSGWGDGMPFQIVGQPTVDIAHRPACFYKRVTRSYFDALQIRTVGGRTFTEQDVGGAPPVIVVNESMRKRFFHDQNPIGKQILIQKLLYGQPGLGEEIPWQVVGVVRDEQVNGLGDQKSPGVYVTFEQSPTNEANLVMRAEVSRPEALVSAIRSAVHNVDKDQALADIRTLENIRTESVSSERMQISLLGMFAAVALLLAAMGIYGVLSYSVTQRIHELGIRAALGASRTGLIGLVLRHGMLLAGGGLILGLVLSLTLGRVLSSLLFGVSARDPITLIASAFSLALVALLACYIPSRRAASVDPIIALRLDGPS